MEGEINCPFVFRTLERLGYDDWMGCEYVPRSNKREKEKVKSEMRCTVIGTVEEGLGWAKEYLQNS